MALGTPSLTHTEATLLQACQSTLRAHLGGYLSTLGAARGRTYPAPASSDVFIGDNATPNHGYPAIGLMLDGGSTWRAMANDTYEVETAVRLVVGMSASAVSSVTPEQAYLAIIDYAHAAAACLARYLPAQQVGGTYVGIGRCDVESTDAQPSTWEDPDNAGWVLRLSEARVRVYWQTLQETPES
jgi:hypothetical protein